jgi:hypothetical protein
MSESNSNDVFAGIDIEEIEVIGKKYRFPLRFYDYTGIVGIFPADATKAKELLPSEKLIPYQPQPNIALVALAGYEYSNIDGLAPYNEFFISILTTYKKNPEDAGELGYYALHLPVTTEEARVLGIEMWGFPKFLADITFTYNEESVVCNLQAEGKDIVTMEAKKIETEPTVLDIYPYTIKDGQIAKTLVSFRGSYGTSTVPQGASIILGNHPISEQLRNISISEKSLQHRYSQELNVLVYLPSEYLPL